MNRRITTKKGYVVACLLLTALLLILLYVGMAMPSLAIRESAKSPTACALQESKPILIITLSGKNAAALCQQTIAFSKGRYFAYYGSPELPYQVVCAVVVRQVRYSVYDAIAASTPPGVRYSTRSMCPTLQRDHRLVGQGF